MPPFQAEQIDLWLTQVECGFKAAHITDAATKFNLTVAHLPLAAAEDVHDVIVACPGNSAALFSALKQRLGVPKAARLKALLEPQPLGDQRPSQLLRRLRCELSESGEEPMAGDSSLLRTLFLQRLPPAVRAALSVLPEEQPIAELASAADRVMEASTGPAAHVDSVVTSAPTATSTAATVSQPDIIAALTASVQRLESKIQRQDKRQRDERRRYERQHADQRREGRQRGRPRSPRTPRALSRQQRPASLSGSETDQSDSGFCYYHDRFGADAYRCSPPCNWSVNHRA